MSERDQEHPAHDDALARANRSIAHELRNVFSVINACAVDLYDAMYGRAAGSLVMEILNAAERGLTVTTDLMRSVDDGDDDQRPTDLRRQVTDLEPMLRRLATPGVALHLDCDGDAAFARIDRTGVMQILMNLVANATDALQRRGTITVGCGRSVRSSSAGDEPVPVAILSVTDDGPGIAPDLLSRVFDDGFSTKSGAHCGLGLAVVRRVVDRCGGWVSVHSVAGEGTTFRVELPLVDAPTSGIALVVVADDAARAALVDALSDGQVEVVHAADVLDACDLMAGRPIADIAILDTDAAADRGLWHMARLRHVARTCAVGDPHGPLPRTVDDARALVAACTRTTLSSPVVETPVPSPPPEWQRRSPIP